MSIVLLKKRLKRKWNQWIDPEFDGDEYAERLAFTENDSDYYERCRRIINGRIYCLIENEDDKRDFFFRRLDVSDSCEYYVGLDNNDEFNMVLKGFVYTPEIGQLIRCDTSVYGYFDEPVLLFCQRVKVGKHLKRDLRQLLDPDLGNVFLPDGTLVGAEVIA